MAASRPLAGSPVGAGARAGACPLSIELCRELRTWLGSRARFMSYELGTDAITPGHVAHQVLLEAKRREELETLRRSR